MLTKTHVTVEQLPAPEDLREAAEAEYLTWFFHRPDGPETYRVIYQPDISLGYVRKWGKEWRWAIDVAGMTSRPQTAPTRDKATRKLLVGLAELLEAAPDLFESPEPEYEVLTLSDGTEFKLKYANLLPDLKPEEYADLRESIRKHGIQVPIVATEENIVIDGQHRLRIAVELGLSSHDVPQQLPLKERGESDLSAEQFEKYLAIDINHCRRHIDVDDRAKLVADLKADGMSNRTIAKTLKVSEGTVRNDLKKCSGAQSCAPEHPERDSIDVDERRTKVAQLRKEGATLRAIAEATGFSTGTIQSDLKAVIDCDLEQLPEPTLKPAEAIESEPEAEVEQPPEPTAEAETVQEAPKPEPAENRSKTRRNVGDCRAEKLDSDRWVVKDEKERVVGMVTRGGPNINPNRGYTGHLLLDGVEYPIFPPYGVAHDSIKNIVADIAKAHKSPKSFRAEEERRREYYQKYLSGAHKRPILKFPKEPFHDLDLSKEGWKESNSDIITDSFWRLGARAKGDGHSAAYHGNFVPQVPYQSLMRFTRAGDVVLDFFLGGGTSMVEALRVGRHFVGVDIKEDVVDAGLALLSELENPHDVECRLIAGDSRGAMVEDQIRRFLSEHETEHVDHVFMHPPYWNIIEFSEDSRCLSQSADLEQFLKNFQAVAWRAKRLLAPGRFLTLVIGDLWVDEWTSLQTHCINVFRKLGGFALWSVNVKDIQGNEKGAGGINGGLQRKRALKSGSAVFKHEYVIVLRRGLDEVE